MSGFDFVRNVWCWFFYEMSCVRNFSCVRIVVPRVLHGRESSNCIRFFRSFPLAHEKPFILLERDITDFQMPDCFLIRNVYIELGWDNSLTQGVAIPITFGNSSRDE